MLSACIVAHLSASDALRYVHEDCAMACLAINTTLLPLALSTNHKAATTSSGLVRRGESHLSTNKEQTNCGHRQGPPVALFNLTTAAFSAFHRNYNRRSLMVPLGLSPRLSFEAPLISI